MLLKFDAAAVKASLGDGLNFWERSRPEPAELQRPSGRLREGI